MTQKGLQVADDTVATGADGGSSRSSRRSQGLQARSRDRIDQLLTAAENLIAEQGFEGLKMRELARVAGLPIASIYHYFPSNAAILRALAEKHFVDLRDVIADAMEAEMHTALRPADAPEAVGRVVRRVADYLRSSSASPAIWDSLRAVPELRALDIEDTQKNARFIEAYMGRVVPQADPQELSDFCLILVEALQSNLMIIMHCPPERQEQLTRSLTRFAVATIRGFQAG